jgi:hypothetical protein
MLSLRAAPFAILAMGVAGCAPIISGAQNAGTSEELVRSETASYFGVGERSVTVSNYEKGLLATTYQARVRGVLYNCRYYYASVDCNRPGQGQL